MTGKYKLVIFDLDGTLIDSITDVAVCFNEALRENGLLELGMETYLKVVGGDLDTIVSKLIPDDRRTPELIEQVKATYRAAYLNSPKPNTVPYAGIPAVLDALSAAGVTMAVNTNKSQTLAQEICKAQFADGLFLDVVGYDESHPSKPDPYGVRQLMAQCGATAQETVYVGDGRSDIDTARNADIDMVLVHWGQSTGAVLQDAYPKYHALEPRELIKVLLS